MASRDTPKGGVAPPFNIEEVLRREPRYAASLPLPEAPALSPAQGIAEDAKEIAIDLCKKHDEAYDLSSAEIDKLIARLTEYKRILSEKTKILKNATMEHYGFTSDVMLYTDQADKHLKDRANGKVKPRSFSEQMQQQEEEDKKKGITET